jgi:hypothetical protein
VYTTIIITTTEEKKKIKTKGEVPPYKDAV